ncbi:glycosyl transferase [Pedobacter yonginense]|uniref:Glycosyl transferase n=1 Tax=Pedobacter yonginense TaxID=651869 RepID=A0A317EK18_9SPHI|nr:glycosyltransferase family 2 protein [Pedobacter yonginense]PWS26429.1 glycosyl transferase [Pedobacter yonginense]
MKISLVTVVYNGEAFLKNCIESVIAQSYTDVEYIVIDGSSVDSTLDIIEAYRPHIHKFVSEQDRGLYDAINKGIKMASGDIVGILNADDMFASDAVLKQVAEAFIQNPHIDAVYGDLNYVHPHTLNILRTWKSRQTSWIDIGKGWMPAHPTLYLKRTLFEKLGPYALDLGTTADYDLIVRYFYKHKIVAQYLPKLMVNMRTGGLSNKSFNSRYLAFKNDYKVLKRNEIPNPMITILRKKFGKLLQFI